MSLKKARTSLLLSQLFTDQSERLSLSFAGSKKNLDREIKTTELHRPGLALSGFFENFNNDSLQIIGKLEYAYIESLEPEERQKRLRALIDRKIPGIIIADGLSAHKELLETAEKKGVGIITSSVESDILEKNISYYLYQKLAARKGMHGSLVDVYGIGMLYIGKSGVGKSECVIDLVERGHRLVADDIVYLWRHADGSLIGESSNLSENLMELRGVGIIDVYSIYGIRAVRKMKKVEIVLELAMKGEENSFERLGLDEEKIDYLGVKVPKYKVVISSAKNIRVISEVIAMNMLLKINKINPARDFNKLLNEKLEKEGVQGIIGNQFF